MHFIPYVLFIMTIVIKISGNRMVQDRRTKSQNSPKYFSHDDSGMFQRVQEVENLQDDPKTNLAPIEDQNLLQDLDDGKRHHGQVSSLQKNIERENPLRHRNPSKKKHRHKRKRKKKKSIKGRKKGSQKHSKAERERNEMDVSNYKTKSKVGRQNQYHPKKFTKKLRRSKSKISSPYNNVIKYLKSGQHSKLDNSEIYKNKYSQDETRHKLSNYAVKLPQDYNKVSDESRIRAEKEKNQIKRSPPSNFETKNKIPFQDEECENNCENKNLDARYSSCKNGKAVDFEKQLHILNNGGEEVQTTKEKPGILNGIQNFFKHSLKHDRNNCSLLTTTLNPHRYQNQNSKQGTTIIESSTLTIGETTSESNSEVNTKANNETNNEYNYETNNEANNIDNTEYYTEVSTETRTTNFGNRKTVIEIEDNTESFTKEISTNLHIRDSTTVTTTTEKEKMYWHLRHTIELDNKDSNTTPFPYNNLWNESGNDDEDSGDNLAEDKKCKEPLPSFTLEIKANPSAKKEIFRIKMKY